MRQMLRQGKCPSQCVIAVIWVVNPNSRLARLLMAMLSRKLLGNTAATGQKRAEARKTSKFLKGQDLIGAVKNLTRSGAFVSLPEGEEGFLPTSEEADDGLGSMMGATMLEIGQEVNVLVMRIVRGQIALTTKKEEDMGKLDAELTQGVVHVAKNPFILAFQKNKEIAVFLSEREKSGKPDITTASEEDEGIPECVDGIVPDSSGTSLQTEVKDMEGSSADLSTDDNLPAVSLTYEEAPAAGEPKAEKSLKNDLIPEASESTDNLEPEEAATTVEPKADEPLQSDPTPGFSEPTASLVFDGVLIMDEQKVDESVKNEPEDSLVKDDGQVEETVANATEEVADQDKVELS